MKIFQGGNFERVTGARVFVALNLEPRRTPTPVSDTFGFRRRYAPAFLIRGAVSSTPVTAFQEIKKSA